MVFKKEQCGKYNSFKYFLGYNDNDAIRLLYLGLLKMTGYINKFYENKVTMSLMVKDKQLLKNYSKLWRKIERLMSIDFDSKTSNGHKNKNKNIRQYNYKFL